MLICICQIDLTNNMSIISAESSRKLLNTATRSLCQYFPTGYTPGQLGESPFIFNTNNSKDLVMSVDPYIFNHIQTNNNVDEELRQHMQSDDEDDEDDVYSKLEVVQIDFI